MFFYRGTRIFAARLGDYKAHYFTRTGYRDKAETPHNPPLLYNLAHDPGEHWDKAEEHPEILAQIAKAVEAHKATVKTVENQLEKRDDSARTDLGDNSTEALRTGGK